ncbi:MAG: flagellar hook-associated protein FlgL [Gammaproteobacteria bacterium]|nr:flagellar hook-associated protein FlgL [Gammaproteobacteria bacterium]MBU1623800.1 flagellar hook-associated protein FlgL [Gammaproteobacteria bacterium]MBU1982017.1 flagellar hook-associated protein FlgL [Gammaproteobacteria bacterium]
MRISTSTLYSEGVTAMQQMQSNLSRTQLQMTTGQRMLSPADDPAAAARAIELKQSDASNTQLASNRQAAMNTLSLEDGVLGSITSLLQDVKIMSLDAGGSLQTASSLKGIATDLRGRMQELFGLSNSTDGLGNFLFSGSQGKIQPFADTAAGATYQGDDVQRLIQAGPTRQISSADSGADIFMRIKNGNGSFATSVAAANTGSGTVSQGQVLASPFNGNTYQVTFTSATTFDIQNVTTGTPVSTGNAYVSGQAITFDGIQVEIKGAPASGDTFDIQPSVNQSVFETIKQFLATVNAPPLAGDAAANAKFQQGLQQASAALDLAINNVMYSRATVGARLRELDSLQATGVDLGVQYQQTLSKIQDTDYIQAATDMSKQQLALQASQQSFAKISQMSLFDYLR